MTIGGRLCYLADAKPPITIRVALDLEDSMYRRRFLRVFITIAIIIFIGSNSRYLMAQPAPEENILGETEFVGKLSEQLVKKMEEMKKSGESHIEVNIRMRIDGKPPQFPGKMLTEQEKQACLKNITEFYANQKSINSVMEKLESMGHQILDRFQYGQLISVRMPIDDVAKVAADPNIIQIYPRPSTVFYIYPEPSSSPVRPYPKGNVYTYDGGLTVSLQNELKQNAPTVWEYVKYLEEIESVTSENAYSALIFIHPYTMHSYAAGMFDPNTAEWVAVVSSIPEIDEEVKVIIARLDYRTFDLKGIDKGTYPVENPVGKELSEVIPVMEEELRLNNLISSQESCMECIDLSGEPCDGCSVHKENVQISGENYIYSVADFEIGGTIIVNKYIGKPIFFATTGWNSQGSLLIPQCCSPLAERNIYIPGTRVKGKIGTEIRIPVMIQNAPHEVEGFDFEVMYEESAFEYIGLEWGELAESLDSVGGGKLSTGGILIAGRSDNGHNILQDASGCLVWLKLKLKSEEENCYLFQLLDIGSGILSDFSESGGFICIRKCDEDLNGDGVITPADALLAFRCYLESDPCHDCTDIDENGAVTPQDALCIFQKYLGLSDVPPC